MTALVRLEDVESKIIEIRNQKVLLDSDVAELYSVATREINQAVKNNPKKFPQGYILELNQKEWNQVKSKFLTSPLGGGKVKDDLSLCKSKTKTNFMLSVILNEVKNL